MQRRRREKNRTVRWKLKLTNFTGHKWTKEWTNSFDSHNSTKREIKSHVQSVIRLVQQIQQRAFHPFRSSIKWSKTGTRRRRSPRHWSGLSVICFYYNHWPINKWRMAWGWLTIPQTHWWNSARYPKGCRNLGMTSFQHFIVAIHHCSSVDSRGSTIQLGHLETKQQLQPQRTTSQW